MQPIKITAEGNFKSLGNKKAEILCDDAIIIFSKINGAVMGAAKNGDPSFTREVNAWVVGFDTTPDVYTRISQGVLQLFSASEDEKANQYNLINLIQFLITNGGLRDKVRLSISEELIHNTKEDFS